MRWVHFGLDLFRETSPAAEDRAVEILAEMLSFLIWTNESYLDLHPDTPLLYDSGVRYEQEPPRLEMFKSIPLILQEPRNIDCEDLACWRVAELRRRFGIGAGAFYYWRELPGKNIKMFHIQVIYPDGSIEDPSARLGMNSDVRARDGRRVLVKEWRR